MKYSSDDIVNAAQAIRPYLLELLDAPQAQRIEKKLENFLCGAALESDSYTQLNTILLEHEATREWLRLYLEEDYTADIILDTLRIYYPLRGVMRPMKSPRYICPVEFCHQDWYRQDLDDAIPKCPVHDLQLIIDSAG